MYIDNFKCLANFEHKLTQTQLILGANGSGKTSFLEALLFVRQFAITGVTLSDTSILSYRTRWQDQQQVTWEVEVHLEQDAYVYRLVIESWREPNIPRVSVETVKLNGKSIFEFIDGEVHLFNDRFEQKVQYEFDWNRSALGTILPRKDNQKLTRFKQFLSSFYFFRINPFAMETRSEKEQPYPTVDLTNIASWYRHLLQEDPKQNSQLLESLRESVQNFNYLGLEAAGENFRVLAAEFANGGEATTKYYFHELSEGQRCLVALYAIVHFLLAKGNTVVIDEPDNFVSLREIQPWLMAAEDAIERGHGQLIIISHHPEVMNQWAYRNGVLFSRDGKGPVRVRDFATLPNDGLSAAELVARGWENE